MKTSHLSHKKKKTLARRIGGKLGFASAEWQARKDKIAIQVAKNESAAKLRAAARREKANKS